MQKTTNPTDTEVPSNKHQHNTSDIKDANFDDSFQDDINLNSNDKQYYQQHLFIIRKLFIILN